MKNCVCTETLTCAYHSMFFELPIPERHRVAQVVEKQVSWIECITRHVQDGHKYFAPWCGECRHRRNVAFFEMSLLGTLIIFLAAYPWVLEFFGK